MKGREREPIFTHSPQHRPVSPRDANRPCLGVEPVVERRPDGEHPAPRSFARFEHNSRLPRLPQNRGRPQARQTGADDDDRRGRRPALVDAQRRREERQLQKLAAIKAIQ